MRVMRQSTVELNGLWAFATVFLFEFKAEWSLKAPDNERSPFFSEKLNDLFSVFGYNIYI